MNKVVHFEVRFKLRFQNFDFFQSKNSWITHDLAREYLWSGKRYRPGQKLKRLSKSCSLHSKKMFLLGWVDFLMDVISGGLLGHFHLALGPNCQTVVFHSIFFGN